IRADVNKCNKEPGLTPLTMACLKGYKDVVRLLLHKKADKEKHVSYLTPLVAAARDGQVDIIRLLVKQRADIDTADGGWTALRIATQENQVESARALLKLGADKHRPSKDGFTASQLAYFCLQPDAYPEIRSLLLESVPEHLIAPTQTATFNASPFYRPMDTYYYWVQRSGPLPR
ncbi:Ankrd17, partial [Symbiodinium sp. CCMP2456]